MYKGYCEIFEMRTSGVKSYFNATGTALLENIISLIYCISIMCLSISHIFGSELERMFLALAAVSGYSYLFFFLLAFKLTGPMVIMVYRMLCNDVLKFCIVYIVFLGGFGQAFFVLRGGHSLFGSSGILNSI